MVMAEDIFVFEKMGVSMKAGDGPLCGHRHPAAFL